MDLEILMSSDSKSDRDKYHILVIYGILKKNELIYKTEIDSQT